MPTEYGRPADLDQAVPLDRLEPWLRTQVPGLGADLQVSQLAGGASNLTFRLSDGTRHLVLRRPPLHGGLATAHDMGREFRVQHGLAETAVPVARMVGLCDDSDVIGAPFYVMEWLDGIVYDDTDAVADLSPETSRAASFELIDVLATLHAVEPAAVGLGDFGRPSGFLERQMRRWHGQWEASKTTEMPELDELAARLSKTLPPDARPAIVHGDYSFNNTMFRRDDRSRILAVLDWELSTLGDPLTDLGTLTAYWGDAGEVMWRGRTPQAHRANDGFPPAEVLLERYAATSGADLSRIDFYQAFALFKLAVISQGAIARLGHDDPDRLARTLSTIRSLTELAAATLRGGLNPVRPDLTPDQEFLRETTARFLDDQVPVGEVRRLRDDPDGYDESYWRRGAELGWTSLAVSEAAGGGTVSGSAMADLTLIAHEFGRHAAPGPLVPTNVVAAALGRSGSHPDVLGALLDGSTVATWANGEPRPNDRLGACALTIRLEGGDVALDGVKRPVESAGRSSHLLVTGRTGDGHSLVLVPRDTPGVAIRPMSTVDLTRRFDVVTFDGVRVPADAAVGELGGADAEVDRLLRVALVMATAESVGAMQTALDITVEWAFDRYSFGRPLASYQALKHRFADMASWLEASHAIADQAAAAVEADDPDADLLLSAAKAYVGRYGGELMQECIQLHGGIGVTYEHDLHLYVRRHTVDTALYGTPGEHRHRITDLVERQEVPA